MKFKSIAQLAAQWLLVTAFLTFGFAMAQAEPTLNQVYATAQSGRLDEAQVMIQQVLISHPNSGKAHFVRAELFARQGKPELARESLATAEKLVPGLSFAKPEAVQALRMQLASKSAQRAITSPTGSYALPTAPAPASPWMLPLLLAGGVLIAGYFLFRRRAPASVAPQPGFANQGGLNGAQRFGLGAGAAPAANPLPPAYPQPGTYPQPGFPPPTGPSLGGRIMGGVATGLAVGAGMMAMDAIGKNLMGNHNTPAVPANSLGSNDYQAVGNNNPDMGGSNFGISDTSSWDDVSSSDMGGDWDN